MTTNLTEAEAEMIAMMRNLECSPLTNAELQMIAILREWHDDETPPSGSRPYVLSIQRQDGAWEIALSSPIRIRHGERKGEWEQGRGARGVGATFADAWDSMNPTWA